MKKTIPSRKNQYSLVRLLNKPYTYFDVVGAEEFLQRLETADDATTVHAYNVKGKSKASNRVLYWLQHLSSHNQIYLARNGEDIALITGGSSSSGRREAHNKILEGLIQHEGLRNKLDTAMLVLYDTTVLASMHTPHYAYMNFSIGSNIETDVRALLQETPLPFTELQLQQRGIGRTIRYHNPKTKRSRILYKTIYDF